LGRLDDTPVAASRALGVINDLDDLAQMTAE
jgi:hypothetical protein